MKESKLLKIISYLIIPAIIAVMILSIMSNYVQNYESIYENEKDYFATDNFVSRYISILSHFSNCLIYQNEEYPICYDGEVQISYVGDSYINDDINIQDCYVFIQYKDKAITNVELTSETNTIEKIKNFIAQNENAKKVNILAGNIEADSDIVTNKAIKYFQDFETTYYTMDKKSEVLENAEEPIEVTEELETSDLETVYETPNSQQNREYITTHIQDFNIYSSYKEELKENTSEVLARELLSDYQELGNDVYVIVPAFSALLLLIGIYLIVSIGHSKGKEGIELNDIDKIPGEIVGFVALLILGIGVGMLEGAGSLQENTDLCVGLLVTAYLIVYIVCAVLFDTTVKRIKAKTLFKNTLTYRCWKWFINQLKKVKNKIKDLWNQSKFSKDIVKKMAFIVVGYIVVAIILLGIFNMFGLLLDLGLAIFIFYKVVERINCFTKIENHLKEMYEGSHPEKLDPIDFTSEFQNTVTYINDISGRF